VTDDTHIFEAKSFSEITDFNYSLYASLWYFTGILISYRYYALIKQAFVSIHNIKILKVAW